MYPLIPIFAALSVVGLTMLARAVRSAPEAYEDSNGFHACNPNDLVGPNTASAPFGMKELLLREPSCASQPWS